jgi:hypothetical protein
MDISRSDHMLWNSLLACHTASSISEKNGSDIQPCDSKPNAVMKLPGTYRSNSHNSIKMVDINVDKHSE